MSEHACRIDKQAMGAVVRHWLVCSCGWIAPPRTTVEQAMCDRAEHEQAVSA